MTTQADTKEKHMCYLEELRIGDSAFESWYSSYSPAHKSDKQRARDAYAAGMGDPLVTAAPAAVAGPVVNRATVIEWLDANDIEVTDRQMDGLFHFAAPTTQPAPQQGVSAAGGDSFLLLPTRPAPDAPANTAGLSWNAYSGAQMLAYGRACSDAALVVAAPQPSPAAQADSVLEDAARYRLVRRGQHWSVIDGIGNALRAEELDAAVDAARAAQEGKSHDN